MAIFGWVLAAAGLGLLFLVVQSVYLGAVLRWEDQETVGLGYYGRPLDARNRFKRTLRLHARLLAPILRLNTYAARFDFRRVSFSHKGVAGPLGTCSSESFAAGESYQPRPEDIFVVTQMKCGTTWMQQVVYEVLHRGRGTLVETGTELYAVSPWLEGRKSVPVTLAPALGAERPGRIIKTHFPAALCPEAPQTRYIYVARHPVSCLASCMDFIATNVGGLAPGIEACVEWFCSRELMWWGTWPDHVAGWWDRAQRQQNVLFLYFEDMKRDLPGTVRQVAAFLGVEPLSEAEVAAVAGKCGFEYMQRHQDMFEMHPPHLLQANAELFVRGTADRHLDIPEEHRQRILGWCGRQLEGRAFPVERAYPDVARAGAAESGSAGGG
ncbi:MAG: sulfotransferase domain-containing protein, partial [Gemmatimonadota bacterium]|nr:sulfotransferase domain-containing protein [Gemmatimonadota bacterium]MDH5282891.1 sulfotransferase domain-containing protein [Gemmatimonadota bacterium]